MNAIRPLHPRPAAWAVLEAALTQRRPVRARYHGHQRVLCPHVLGWHNRRAQALCYQSSGTTSHGPLPDDPTQRWRLLFVDEIHDATIIDSPWQTADNYTPHPGGLDQIELTVNAPTGAK